MMTGAQLAALKAAIEADSNINGQPNNPDGHFFIAAYYNVTASPDYYVWRDSVSTVEIMGNGFVWDRVDNMDAGKARIWDFMTRLGTLNPSQSNVRAGVNAAFPTGANDAMRAAIFGHFQRLATRVEKLFATGSGVASTNAGVGPSTLGFVGPLSADDVELARGLP